MQAALFIAITLAISLWAACPVHAAEPSTNEPVIEQSDSSSCIIDSVNENAANGLADDSSASNNSMNDNSANGSTDFGQYITGVILERVDENGKWIAVSGAQIIDGDTVRLTVAYAIPSYTVDHVNNSITYQLPSGVKLTKTETGYVTREVSGANVQVGTYEITTSGGITITFYDEFADGQQFTGNIRFLAKVIKTEAGEDGKIEFGGSGGTIIIEDRPAEYDIHTEKKGSYEHRDENARIQYTVTTSSEKGTDPDKSVKIVDVLDEAYNGANYDIDSFVIQHIDPSGTISDISGQYKSQVQIHGKSWTLDGLPALKAGEQYIVIYTATPDESASQDDGYLKVRNVATSSSGDNADSDSNEIVVHEARLAKSGEYDTTNNCIHWTIVVNKGYEHLQNYTITDTLPDGLTIQGNVKIIEKLQNGEEQEAVWIEPKDGTDITPHQIRRTFDNTNSRFTITFDTNAPKASGGDDPIPVENTVSDDDGKRSKGTAVVIPEDLHVEKDVGNMEVDPDTGTIYRSWDVDITLDTDTNYQTIVCRDWIEPALYRNGTEIGDYSNTHYTTWTELRKLTTSSVKLVRRSGYNPLAQGLDVSIKAWENYDKDNKTGINEVPSGDITTRIRYWEMTITLPAENQNQVAGIGFSYRTITDYSMIPDDTEWWFTNNVYVLDEYDSDTFSYSRKEQLEKAVASTLATDDKKYAKISRSGFQNVSSSFVLGDDGTYWYRVLLQTTYQDTGDIELVDTLPAGLSIEDLSDYLNDNSTIKTTINQNHDYIYDDNSPIWIFMGSNNNYKGDSKRYVVERSATVSYDESSRHLTIKIPYKDREDSGGTYQYWGGSDSGQQMILPYFEILYKVKVTSEPSTWDDDAGGTNKVHTFTNTVSRTGGKSSTVDAIVSHPKQFVRKLARQIMDDQGRPTSAIEYAIVINPNGEDLTPQSDTLMLEDQLTVADGVQANLLPDTVQLYDYDASKASNHYHGDTPLSRDLIRITSYDSSKHSFKVQLPDQRACVLVYQYMIDLSGETTAQGRTVANSARLNAEWSSTESREYRVQASSGSVDYNTVYVYKVDATDYSKFLQGVRFSLQRWQINDATGLYEWQTVKGGHATSGLFETDAQGRLTLRTQDSAQNAQLYNNTLYRLREVSLGSNKGYRLAEEPLYFMLHDAFENETAQEAFMRISGKQTIKDTDPAQTITFSMVKVCEVPRGGAGVLYFENTPGDNDDDDDPHDDNHHDGGGDDHHDDDGGGSAQSIAASQEPGEMIMPIEEAVITESPGGMLGDDSGVVLYGITVIAASAALLLWILRRHTPRIV